MTARVPKVPKESGGDAAHKLARVGIAAIPVVGGSATELFEWLIRSPLEKRRDEWMAEVSRLLEELSEEGLDLTQLKDSPEFISVVVHASHVALKHHHEAKKEALQNAIRNAAYGQSVDDSLLHTFIDLVDTLTEWHIRMLKLFQNPPSTTSNGGLSSVLERNLPELCNRREVYDQFWRDLYLQGLVNTDNLHIMMTGMGLAQKRTTALGDAFLDFIS